MNKMLIVFAVVLLVLSIVPLVTLWSISPGITISVPALVISGLAGRRKR